MTLIELIEYASELLKKGTDKAVIQYSFVMDMGVARATADVVLDGLNDDGTFRRTDGLLD